MDSIENFIIRDHPYVTPLTTLEEAGRHFKEKKITQLSIVDVEHEHRPVGILNEHGLMERCLSLGNDFKKVPVKECMERLTLIVRPDMGTEHCHMVMSQHHVAQAPVADAKGHYIGEVRLSDLPSDQ